jgi:2-polyprenyl-6-methoxyphenol hydroxylase-like FAD-dependent oxidoreductase
MSDPAGERAYDLVVVGGGIGGSALATVMARAGARVLVLEASEVFEDKVRGEWIAPWGVAETRRLGLYDLLVSSGGHHVGRHVTYDESLDPAAAEEKALPLGMFLPDVPGPLCIGHPHHCQTLFDEAGRAGAKTLRGVEVTAINLGAAPEVRYVHDGESHGARARLIIGADGRTSPVREAAGIVLHQDRPHHMFAGMLVDDVAGWDADLQAIGTEGDFAFLTFPQGGGRARVYGSFSLEERRRFAGPDGPQRFLDAFRMACAPANAAIAEGRPAGPLLAYFNHDSWTDRPFAEGVALIGDAAGWNDPIIGQGLSITYRDVRMVSEILRASEDWSAAAFAPYGEERAERMRRLRFAAALTSALDAEFGPQAQARRARYFSRSRLDPQMGARGVAVMAGPEMLPPEMFTDEHWTHVLGEDA